jgi:hypothetical protein
VTLSIAPHATFLPSPPGVDVVVVIVSLSFRCRFVVVPLSLSLSLSLSSSSSSSLCVPRSHPRLLLQARPVPHSRSRSAPHRGMGEEAQLDPRPHLIHEAPAQGARDAPHVQGELREGAAGAGAHCQGKAVGRSGQVLVGATRRSDIGHRTSDIGRGGNRPRCGQYWTREEGVQSVGHLQA